MARRDSDRERLAKELADAYADGAARGWDATRERVRKGEAQAEREGEPVAGREAGARPIRFRARGPRPRRAWATVAVAALVAVLVGVSILVGALSGAFFPLHPGGTPTPKPTGASGTPAPTAVPTIDIRDQEKYITVKVDPVLPLATASNALSAEYVASLQRLGTGMLNGLARDARGENLLLSPVSLSMCFSMLLPGAAGETRTEMIQALGYREMSLDAILAQNKAAFENLYRDDGPLQVRIANSLWCLKDFPFEAAFLDTAKTDFFASIRSIDRASGADPLKLINRWVSDRTNQRIPRLLDSLDPQTALVLVNAVSFLGEWEIPFDSKSVVKAPFTRADGTVVQADMMGGYDSFRIRQSDGAVSVALAYRNGMAMVLTLPAEGTDLGAMTEAVLAEMGGWKDWKAGGFALQLPRFGFSTSLDLKPRMQALGMVRAFGLDADFSGVSPQWLCVSQAVQKTFLSVTEKGTEAEAATAVVMNGGIPQVVAFDRPFWFAILDEQGVPLFLGTVQDPTEIG